MCVLEFVCFHKALHLHTTVLAYICLCSFENKVKQTNKHIHAHTNICADTNTRTHIYIMHWWCARGMSCSMAAAKDEHNLYPVYILWTCKYKAVTVIVFKSGWGNALKQTERNITRTKVNMKNDMTFDSRV